MKCLIGILYSGETQLEACIAAIKAQVHTDWELVQISNLPKKEAHEQLFNTFNESADQFDLFVKIDADMELCHKHFLSTLCDYFEHHPDVDQLTMKVDDFYTARLVWGLNVFRSSVVFSDNDDVYTDRAAIVQDDKIVRLKRHKILVPAARHGYDPAEFHSFYFGCHKAVKVMHRQSRAHMRNIKRLPMAAVIQRDFRPLIAYAGAAMAFEKQLGPDSLDRGTGELQELFESQCPSKHSLVGALSKYRKIVRHSATLYLG